MSDQRPIKDLNDYKKSKIKEKNRESLIVSNNDVSKKYVKRLSTCAGESTSNKRQSVTSKVI